MIRYLDHGGANPVALQKKDTTRTNENKHPSKIIRDQVYRGTATVMLKAFTCASVGPKGWSRRCQPCSVAAEKKVKVFTCASVGPKRRKSIDSTAASISACQTFLPVPSITAAQRSARYLLAINSEAYIAIYTVHYNILQHTRQHKRAHYRSWCK